MAMKRLVGLIKNKFFLVTVAFIVWMLAFDKNDLHSQYQYFTEVRKAQKERDFYLKETNQANKDLNELSTNPATLEKFAREKYLMKKDNEDVFVVVRKKKSEE